MYWRQVVSQSPTTADVDQSVIDNYLAVWEPLNKRILTGSSFSGNERNCCFLNTGKQRFADVSAASNLHYLDDGRSIAVSDWDQDGDVDIWMTNRTSPRIRYLRNDTPTVNSFVAFQLEGLPSAKCPRDAYGARVEIKVKTKSGVSSSRSQTLYGGDSFLSQSTKWLHFGIRPDEEIDSVNVRWPGSKTPEAFTGVKSGSRWQLVQSKSVAKLLPSPTKQTPLESSNLAGVPVVGTGRLKISWPKSVGELAFQDMNGARVIRKEVSERPSLYVCWASWCQPCLVELKEIAETNLGDVDVIALNIEHATLGEAPTNAEMEEILDRQKFKGIRGVADRTILGTLNQRHLDAIYLRSDLPLPVSFLVDDKGYLRVIYKGKLDVAQVAEDISQLDAVGRNSMSLAIPFPGRWSEEHLDGNPIAVARVYQEDGSPKDAETFLKYYLELTNPEKEPNASLSEAEAQNVMRLRAASFYELGMIAFRSGQPDNGLSYCQQSHSINPKSVPTLLAIISHFAANGESKKAEPYCEKVKLLASGHPRVEYQLGQIELIKKKYKAAVAHFQTAVDANPRMVTAANNLAWILATNNDEKIRNGERAVKAAILACEATGYRDYRLFSTLAAAYAEAGDFQNAIKITKRGIEMATAKGDTSTVNSCNERLKLFEANKPYRD